MILLLTENKHKQRPKSLKLWFPPKNISEIQCTKITFFILRKYIFIIYFLQ